MTPSIAPDASRVATIVLSKYPSTVAPVESRTLVCDSRATCGSPVRNTCSSTARWPGSGSMSANRFPITSFSVRPISASCAGLTIAKRRSGPRSMPTRAGDEAVAAGGVARGDGARRPGETLAHLGKRVLIRQRVAGAPGADELVTEPIDDAQLDRGAGHHVVQLLLDVRERERAREHALGPAVEGDRHREDDRFRVQRPARDEHGPDAVLAGDRGLEVVAVRDIHAVRGRGKT